eukprot:304565-Pyramimonas_sp.AAC.1
MTSRSDWRHDTRQRQKCGWDRSLRQRRAASRLKPLPLCLRHIRHKGWSFPVGASRTTRTTHDKRAR